MCMLANKVNNTFFSSEEHFSQMTAVFTFFKRLSVTALCKSWEPICFSRRAQGQSQPVDKTSVC